MSTNKTTNFGLSQWQSTDPIRVADFNADNQKLDDALAARAQLATGSYTGTGKFGSANPNTLTFPFEPKFVFVTNLDGSRYLFLVPKMHTQTSDVTDNSDSDNAVSWSKNSVTWYNRYSEVYQLNLRAMEYQYIAIG